ncbi:hypothetical protein [Nocardia iowensis]|uniref:DUF11 domain-containing protein n=1 Tax=Nocardia iowensis TaxID=204891 RepID=A0ABX8RKU2_NOCIO|nr:hypothetical protein [Nocardia iowensis]QXN88066.1 hypothetical protein KV110_20790 [Nocardia iowensis]
MRFDGARFATLVAGGLLLGANQPVAFAAPTSPQLTIKLVAEGKLVADYSAVFRMTVANSELAGPTTGTINTSQTYPDGLAPTSANGDGWTCAIAGQVVSCHRPAKDTDTLDPGKSYPPVTVSVDIDSHAAEQSPVTFYVETPDGAKTPSSKVFIIAPPT